MNSFIQTRVVQTLEKKQTIKEEVDVLKDGEPTGEKVEQEKEISVPYTVARLAFIEAQKIDMWFESGEKLERTAVEVEGDSMLLEEPMKDFMVKLKAADESHFNKFKKSVILEAVPSEESTKEVAREGHIMPSKIGMFIEEGKNSDKVVAMYAGRPLKLGVKIESVVSILKSKGIKVG